MGWMVSCEGRWVWWVDTEGGIMILYWWCMGGVDTASDHLDILTVC